MSAPRLSLSWYSGRCAMVASGVNLARRRRRRRHTDGSRHMSVTSAAFQSRGSQYTTSFTHSPGPNAPTTVGSIAGPVRFTRWSTRHPRPKTRTRYPVPAPEFSNVHSACGLSPCPRYGSGPIQAEVPDVKSHSGMGRSTRRHHRPTPTVISPAAAVASAVAKPTPSQKLLPKSQLTPATYASEPVDEASSVCGRWEWRANTSTDAA